MIKKVLKRHFSLSNKVLKQIGVFLGEKSLIQHNQKYDLKLQEGKESEEVWIRTSGEFSIYVNNETIKCLNKDDKIGQVFNNWVEAYLVALRVYEQGHKSDIEAETAEKFKNILAQNFEDLTFDEYCKTVDTDTNV